MKTCFVDTEDLEEEFFRSRLEGHELQFVAKLQEVPAETEIVCVFINNRVDEAWLAAHPHVRCVVTRSHATDHLDLAACAARGIRVSNVPEHGETSVAEHTFALLLALSRRLRDSMLKPTRHFSYARTRAFELRGKTLGLVGMGRVGQNVAALARGFQMEVLACDPRPNEAAARELGFTYVPFEKILERSHIISLHAPLSPETFHLFNADTFARCRRGVIIINTARGRLLDTGALRDALASGQVGGAGLDVLEDERVMRAPAAQIIAGGIIEKLRTDASAAEAHDADRLREVEELMLGDALLAQTNVVFTPHIAFNSIEVAELLVEATVHNIEAFCNGAPINKPT